MFCHKNTDLLIIRFWSNFWGSVQIDVKDDGFIVIDKKYLYKKDLSGKELWKVKLEKNYIKDEVKVEIAGDWLFIKSFDLKTEQSKLEEKIDLKNGKKTELEKLIN